jgi:hypothetical protein
MYSDSKIQAAADQIKEAWAEARTHALEEGRSYRFSVMHGTGNFRVAPDDTGYWAASESAEAVDPSAPPFMKEAALPEPIVFSSSDSAQDPNADAPPADAAGGNAGGWSSVLTFRPDGTTRDNAKVTIQGKSGRPRVVRMRAWTGVVTDKPLQEDTGP